jgi:hypothetical protein
MTTHVAGFRAVSTTGAHVKRLGYGAFKRYGGEFEVLSDPSLEGDGAAVRVRLKHLHPAASRDGASERKKGERFTSTPPC